jgi:hypothetical protein
MDDWEVWRVAIVVAAWLTVLGGLLMGSLWTMFGGARAAGPEDETLAVAGVDPHRRIERQTSFPVAVIFGHGLVGILTASFITWAASRNETDGYIAVLVAILVTAVPGTVMYLRWKSGQRPRVRGADGRPRVEDRIPKPVVYGHGLMVGVTTLLAVVLLVVT